MFNPPRDLNGNVIPYDEPLLDNDGWRVRYIHPDVHVVFDENLGGRRITSAAFSATSGDPAYGMSVDLGQSLAAAGLAESALVPAGFGAVRLLVGSVRRLPVKVGADPVPADDDAGEPGNPHHEQVWGVKDSLRRKLHRLVDGWVVPIGGVLVR